VHRQLGAGTGAVQVAEPEGGIREPGQRFDLQPGLGQLLGEFAGALVVVGRLAVPAEPGERAGQYDQRVRLGPRVAGVAAQAQRGERVLVSRSEPPPMNIPCRISFLTEMSDSAR